MTTSSQTDRPAVPPYPHAQVHAASVKVRRIQSTSITNAIIRQPTYFFRNIQITSEPDHPTCRVRTAANEILPSPGKSILT